jgi:hypothetical protein
MKIARILLWIFIFTTSLFYGVIFSGQLLGLLKLYNVILAVLLSVLGGGFVFSLFAANRHYLDEFLDTDQNNENVSQKLLSFTLIFVGLTLFAVLALYPLVRWPFSPISNKLTWDAGLYHFPKAIEMISTGSAWDMTIDYGEYPFGYESLLAMAFGLNHSGLLLGLTHALIAVYFFLALWLLIARSTRLPNGLIILTVALLIVSRLYFPKNDNNIWWIIWTQVILIGKNDLLLGAALLSVAVFMPFSGKKQPLFVYGLAVSSMIALSVKPNSALLVLFAWGIVLVLMIRSGEIKSAFKKLAVAALLVLPGVLWAVRNLIAMHNLFKENALKLSGLSIANNITNPFFYDHIPTQFYLVAGIVVMSVLASLFWRKMRVPALVGLVLFLTFILTPASAFLGNNQQPTQIAWRFAVGLLAYEAVLLLLILEPVIIRIYAWVAPKLIFSLLAISLIVFIGALGLRRNRDLLEPVPGGDLVLRDQFKSSVGLNGYFSAYDYVQKNVHNSIVIVENGLPYYLYDNNLTNSVTRSHDADYFVAFKTAWTAGRKEGFPEMISDPNWDQIWQLVYQDSEGRVYKRKP